MKTNFIALIFLFISTISFPQPPTFNWANTIPGTVESIQRGMVVDAAGNVFITGMFFGTVDFDPGVGVANITPVPYGCNVYIAKYDINGNYLWAKNIPITASYGGGGITIDASNNVFITGYFSGTNQDFDPNAGTAYLNSAGGNDIYFAKYDANGNYLWAKQLGSTGDDRGIEISTDATGNVFLIGNFSASVDFDPAAGITNLTSVGAADIFIAKYNSSGIFQWTKQIGGALADDVRDIAFDNSGNIYLTGNFSGTADFDPGVSVVNLVSSGGSDIFISKYDANGNYLWSNKFGGTGTDGGSALKADATGNILVTGIFASTVDFDQSAAVVNLTTASSALFYGKYNAGGNFVWAKQLPLNFYSMDITLDAAGNIFIAGYYGNGFGSPIDMDPGVGVANLNVPSNLPPPTYNILGKYDATGNYLWAGVFGHQCYCSVMAYKASLTTDPSGHIYYSGIFNGPFGTGTVDFDPGAGVYNLNAPSNPDNTFFVKYLSQAVSLGVELVDFSGVNGTCVNHLHWTTASETNSGYFEVQRSADAINYHKIGTVESMGYSIIEHVYSLDDSNCADGINYYRLRQVDIDGAFTYSNVIAVNANNCKEELQIQCSNSSITIYSSSVFQIKIADASGRIVLDKKLSAGSENVDISFLSSGFYVLAIQNQNKFSTKKIIRY